MESSNLGSLHWEQKSLSLDNQGSPRADSFKLQEIGRNHRELNSEKEGWAAQVMLVVKNLPAIGSMVQLVQSLSWEDPLEEHMATRSSILAWRIPWTEEPRGLQSWGQGAGHD